MKSTVFWISPVAATVFFVVVSYGRCQQQDQTSGYAATDKVIIRESSYEARAREAHEKFIKDQATRILEQFGVDEIGNANQGATVNHFGVRNDDDDDDYVGEVRKRREFVVGSAANSFRTPYSNFLDPVWRALKSTKNIDSTQQSKTFKKYEEIQNLLNKNA